MKEGSYLEIEEGMPVLGRAEEDIGMVEEVLEDEGGMRRGDAETRGRGEGKQREPVPPKSLTHCLCIPASPRPRVSLLRVPNAG